MLVCSTKTSSNNKREDEDGDSDTDSDDDRSTSFLPRMARQNTPPAAPRRIQRRLPPANALPRSSSFRKPRSTSSSDSTGTSSGSKTTPRRAVSFNRTEELHRVESVKSLLNFDNSEVEKLWYDSMELETTKTENNMLVEQAESSKAPPLCQETETLRGLESKTEEGSMQSFYHRANALGAVLDHQEEQRVSNAASSCGSSADCSDMDEELASLASQATEDAKQLALQRAVQDEKEAWEYLYGTDNDEADGKDNGVTAANVEEEVPMKKQGLAAATIDKKGNNAATKKVKKTTPTRPATRTVSAPIGSSRNKPAPKRSSLKIPNAFSSTSSGAVPSWVKPGTNANTAGLAKKSIGRSMSFTPDRRASLLLSEDEGGNDSEEEEDIMLMPPKRSSASAKTLAPDRISRPTANSNKVVADGTPVATAVAGTPAKRPVVRSKSSSTPEEASALVDGDADSSKPPKRKTDSKLKRLAEMRAKASLASSLDTPPDVS